MKSEGALEESCFRFDMFGIRKAALNRANSLTGLLLVEPYTFCAELRVDEIGVVAF
jgi:hypothetical protein